jgi:uncharacterized coiled-coil DUF342 family protein
VDPQEERIERLEGRVNKLEWQKAAKNTRIEELEKKVELLKYWEVKYQEEVEELTNRQYQYKNKLNRAVEEGRNQG